jgi:hypothetical protein
MFKGLWESQQPIIPFLDTTFQLIDGSIADAQSISKVADCLTAIHEQMKQNPTHYVKLTKLLGAQTDQPNSKLSSKPIWKYGGNMLIVDVAALAIPLVGTYYAFASSMTLNERLQLVTNSWKIVRIYFNNRYWLKKFNIGDLARIVLLKTKGFTELNDNTLQEIMRDIPEYLMKTYGALEDSIGGHVDILLYWILTHTNPSNVNSVHFTQWKKDTQSRIDNIKRTTSISSKGSKVELNYDAVLTSLQQVFIRNQSGGMRVFVLGRNRKLHKTGKSASKVRYMNKLITLKEAHRIEQKGKINRPLRKT